MNSSIPVLIPRSVLFGNPIKASPQVSPNGKMMAYVAPMENVLNVWVGEIGRNDYRPVTNDRNRGIQTFRWASDNRHILYIQDVDGDENYHLYSVHLETGEIRDLTPFDNVRVRPLLAHSKDHPDMLLLAINKEDPEVFDIYDLHVPSGELRMVAKNPGNVIVWLADADMRVRAAGATREDGGIDLLIRDTPDSEWKHLLTWGPDDSRSSGLGSFSKDGKYLYLFDARGANAARFVAMEIATGKIETIAEDPQYDVSDFESHPDTHEIQLVGFMRDRQEWMILDESVRPDIEKITRLHHGDFEIVSRDDEDRIWVIRFMADAEPVCYYVYDRATGDAAFLFESRPELRNYPLAPMEPISFIARDGLTIHGYITFPPGSDRKNLPMVLNVHGGPWVRDVWGYDAEAQWLANRGYVCLQVNYRGSAGYGKHFLNAGDKEWGGKMHDDLVDAVNWAVARGHVDPERIAIYGGSYGGYAALVGATFTPHLFRCAVDIVGPSNLITFIETIPPYWKPNIKLFHQRVGDPETEHDFLISRSPLFKVDQIRIPLLIAQGANDPRVKQSESEQIVEAMRNKGIEHQYMLFPDEGHGFAKPENRMKFYAAAEQFLAEHLSGRFESDEVAA